LYTPLDHDVSAELFYFVIPGAVFAFVAGMYNMKELLLHHPEDHDRPIPEAHEENN
jgi:hypothetical protein